MFHAKESIYGTSARASVGVPFTAVVPAEGTEIWLWFLFFLSRWFFYFVCVSV